MAADEETGAPKRRIGYDARHALIVQSAMEAFAELGYHQASLDEIARRAATTKAVVYDHFDSKRALHLELLRRQRDEALAYLTERLTGHGAMEDRVATALEGLFAWAESHPYAWRMLFRDSTGDPDIIEEHRRIQREANAAIVAVLLRDTDSRLLLDGWPPDAEAMLGELLGGAVNGLARWWYDNPHVSREHLVALTMNVLWTGLERPHAGDRR